MTGYERIMAVFQGKIPDCVPLWELGVSLKVVNNILVGGVTGTGSGMNGVTVADLVEKLGLDAITTREDQKQDWIDSTTYRDEWGVVCKISEEGATYPYEGPIKEENDLLSYVPPDPWAAHRMESLRKTVDRFKGKKAIMFISHEAFEFSCNLRGMDNLLMDYALNPEFSHQLARKVVDYKKAVISRAIDEGVDIVLTGDDYAFRTGPMMSQTHFREFVVPYMKEVVDLVKSKGKYFIKHCDGRIWPIIDDMIATGIDALHPLEPLAGMDIGEVKSKYGDKIVVIGNVDCGALLSTGTKEEVAEAVKETIAKGSPGGRHILSSSNSIHSSVNPENFKTMIETARLYGQYPLNQQMVDTYKKKNYISKYLGV